MGGLDPRRSIAENYRVFGREARRRSAAYESLAAAVADDGLLLGFREGTFVLGHGSRTPLAFADGHGTWLHWLDGAAG